MNKNRIRRLSTALIFGTLLTLLLSVNAFAANKYVTKSLTLGKAVAVTSENYSGGDTVYTMYKVTVPSGKYLEITCVPVTGKSGNVSIYCKSKALSSYHVTSLYSDSKKTWSGCTALEPGTYYLSFYNIAKAKVSLLTSPNKANYCRAKAISLAAGKTVTVVQTPDIDYNRWYKISLEKAKTLKITTSSYANVYVYTKSGAKVSLASYDSSAKCFKSSSKLAKGTYYICFRANNYFSSGDAYDKKGEYFVAKWS